MDEIESLKKAIEQMKVEIESLSAESLALQYIVVNIASNIMRAQPNLSPFIVAAFDSAANVAEHLSIAEGKRAGHVPVTLKIIEQLRMALTGKSKPQHGI